MVSFERYEIRFWKVRVTTCTPYLVLRGRNTHVTGIEPMCKTEEADKPEQIYTRMAYKIFYQHNEIQKLIKTSIKSTLRYDTSPMSITIDLEQVKRSDLQEKKQYRGHFCSKVNQNEQTYDQIEAI